MNGVHKPRPHFVLVPFMAQGHMIPMVDLAKLLAGRGALVSVVTTRLNANKIRTTIERARDSGLPIRLVELPFPYRELGLPEGCESLDAVPPELMLNFFQGLRALSEPLRMYLQEQHPHVPSCLIVDILHPWTAEVADELRIPRLSFFSICCFTLLCIRNIENYNVYDTVTDQHESFLVPGLAADLKITVTKAQVPVWFKSSVLSNYGEEVRAAETKADGIVVNTFEELEPSYIEGYESVTGKKVWSVGPFSLCNEDLGDMTARGNKISTGVIDRCLSWLDGKTPGSVVYVSFGSLAFVQASQLIEVGLGLEASDHPFVWVIKKREDSEAVEEWLSKGFEERIGSRGLIIKGWAPQVMILSHPAVGGFVTHCGWNSTLEGIAAGVPLITWPHFGDQFLNERIVVDILRIGVSVGVKEPNYGIFEENAKDDKSTELAAKRDDIAKAIRCGMDDGQEAQERRNRVKIIGKKARDATKEGGRSYSSMTELINRFSGSQGE